MFVDINYYIETHIKRGYKIKVFENTEDFDPLKLESRKVRRYSKKDLEYYKKVNWDKRTKFEIEYNYQTNCIIIKVFNPEYKLLQFECYTQNLEFIQELWDMHYRLAVEYKAENKEKYVFKTTQ